MSRGWDMVKKYGFLSLKERDVLSSLADHLDYQNALMDGGVAMTPAMMARAIYEDPRNFHRVLKSLQRKNVMGCWSSNGVNIWYINPDLYRRGQGKKEVASNFKKASIQKEVSEKQKKFSLPHENYYSTLMYP